VVDSLFTFTSACLLTALPPTASSAVGGVIMLFVKSNVMAEPWSLICFCAIDDELLLHLQ
jgi:hypothetical protein